MPPPSFIRHPDARAFAQAGVTVAQKSEPRGLIPAHPVQTSVAMLMGALEGGFPFCVSDNPVPDLPALPHAHFATLTGGTSGPPKVILRSQHSWIRSFHTNADLFRYSARDGIAVLGALGHSLALYGVLEGLHLGLTVHTLSDLSPYGQCGRMAEAECTILYATPAQLRLLPLHMPLTGIRLILCGGGALTCATRAHIAALCPNAALHVFYGAAETSFITLGGPNTPEGSVGRAYPEVELMVRTPDATGTGTIWIRSPYLFERYLSGSSPHTCRDGDWLTVGELGHLDEQGNLFLQGRAGRVFTVADQTIYPEALEEQFCALDGIRQCAVLARPDPLRGRHMVVIIEGPENLHTGEALLTHCRANALTVPRAVLFLDQFPLLPSGKPDLCQIATATGCIL
ncbi:AMP-binding protein [Sulfitobacter guttiformis]|uniref:Long-chain acyl-CoA synthetase n=1 Tax=Sulfitobacter guttiformis TaxID=74349 RepID=A0A420DR49_9RHOB|nr:AMP-binding protein [Sulfitobacter guttiformis]KIN74039.1 AMP-dependent synthetase and ligase [Sulfitobacter guttiformis KCTC 32187]RKE96660.1 long-chain acyl-CoA synthetase [Sulfitobacter guttiformis]